MVEMRERGLCCTTPGAFGFCIATFLIFYGIGLLAMEWWWQAAYYNDAVLFASLGLACIANAVWNRTFHCYLLGPLFLAAAAALALTKMGSIDVSSSLLWGVMLTGAGLAFLLEQQFAVRT